MYYVLAILTAIAFRRISITLLNYVILVIAWEFGSFGIPIGEITFNWILGSLIGHLIVRKFKQVAPPFVKSSLLKNIGGFLQMTAILFFALLLYFNVDLLISENQKPYGLAITFIMISCFLFAACFLLYCLLNIQSYGIEQQHAYWLLWFNTSVVVLSVMFAGFLPSMNSYMKSAFITPIVFLIIFFIK